MPDRAVLHGQRPGHAVERGLARCVQRPPRRARAAALIELIDTIEPDPAASIAGSTAAVASRAERTLTFHMQSISSTVQRLAVLAQRDAGVVDEHVERDRRTLEGGGHGGRRARRACRGRPGSPPGRGRASPPSRASWSAAGRPGRPGRRRRRARAAIAAPMPAPGAGDDRRAPVEPPPTPSVGDSVIATELMTTSSTGRSPPPVVTLCIVVEHVEALHDLAEQAVLRRQAARRRGRTR